VDLANTNCEEKTANRKEYLSNVGSLMYAALGTRPNIAFSVTALSRYNVEPLEMHLTAARRVLLYLKTTSELCIHYRRLRNSHDNNPPMSYVPNSHISVVGFTDSDWAGNLATRKSIGGCMFGLGYIDGMASDGATVVTAIGSHTEGLRIHGYDAFTAHKKDTRKVTTG